MSSKLRWCACLRAWASSLVVFSSSIVTRRPRSAMRSIAFLLAFLFSSKTGLAPRPTLPHAELENGEVGSFQQSARRNHDIGSGNRIFGDRHELLAGFEASGIDPARRRDQLLQRFGGHDVELAVDDATLERSGELLRVRGSAV